LVNAFAYTLYKLYVSVGNLQKFRAWLKWSVSVAEWRNQEDAVQLADVDRDASDGIQQLSSGPAGRTDA